MSSSGWIGVDLDGTLAKYDGWQGADHIGEPIGPMLERVKAWLAKGQAVKIFTARVCIDREAVVAVIDAWCMKHFDQVIEVTNTKDYGMIELWDDRAVQVIPNSGKRADGNP